VAELLGLAGQRWPDDAGARRVPEDGGDGCGDERSWVAASRCIRWGALGLRLAGGSGRPDPGEGFTVAVDVQALTACLVYGEPAAEGTDDHHGWSRSGSRRGCSRFRDGRGPCPRRW